MHSADKDETERLLLRFETLARQNPLAAVQWAHDNGMPVVPAWVPRNELDRYEYLLEKVGPWPAQQHLDAHRKMIAWQREAIALAARLTAERNQEKETE